MAKIRVAIAGVGNCASSLVQGVEFYRSATGDAPIPGLMHLELGGYHIGDIEFVAAFDINRTKVGRDLAEAILAVPNNTMRFAAPHLDAGRRCRRDLARQRRRCADLLPAGRLRRRCKPAAPLSTASRRSSPRMPSGANASASAGCR